MKPVPGFEPGTGDLNLYTIKPRRWVIMINYKRVERIIQFSVQLPVNSQRDGFCGHERVSISDIVAALLFAL
jgi:hypothetical protein